MKIRECPTCYSNEENTVYLCSDRYRSWVYCDNCGMNGAREHTEEEAINQWNRLRNVYFNKDIKL